MENHARKDRLTLSACLCFRSLASSGTPHTRRPCTRHFMNLESLFVMSSSSLLKCRCWCRKYRSHLGGLELLENLKGLLHLGLRFGGHRSASLRRLRGVICLLRLLRGAALAGLAERTLKPEAFDLAVENVEALDLVYLFGGSEGRCLLVHVCMG